MKVDKQKARARLITKILGFIKPEYKDIYQKTLEEVACRIDKKADENDEGFEIYDTPWDYMYQECRDLLRDLPNQFELMINPTYKNKDSLNAAIIDYIDPYPYIIEGFNDDKYE